MKDNLVFKFLILKHFKKTNMTNICPKQKN